MWRYPTFHEEIPTTAQFWSVKLQAWKPIEESPKPLVGVKYNPDLHPPVRIPK